MLISHENHPPSSSSHPPSFFLEFPKHIKHLSLDSDTIQKYYKRVNTKHRKTLEKIFATPVQANIPWQDIEALLIALGAEIKEGSGSRVRVSLR